ncbi:hypothetical protein KP509_37G040800 [Ceratopteris richardii]|uniref:Epidermal patterning factor-like protein n=1 Tax=Ceratopteris richardii TaxID=49495 RepID=A0A8T2Q860_CERRI|nr:hypothetical protein KP509_37G040800 [Ceratopteris richardii]
MVRELSAVLLVPCTTSSLPPHLTRVMIFTLIIVLLIQASQASSSTSSSAASETASEAIVGPIAKAMTSRHGIHKAILGKSKLLLTIKSQKYVPSFWAAWAHEHVRASRANKERSSYPLYKDDRETRALVGSSPPSCYKKCGTCIPCKSALVPIHTGSMIIREEYYPEAWRCQCRGKIYNP